MSGIDQNVTYISTIHEVLTLEECAELTATVEQLKEQEAAYAYQQEEDYFTVKLRNILNDTTEDEIRTIMKRFGNVVRVKIPLDDRNGRSKGFAFVTYDDDSYAQRALEQGEVTIGFSSVDIERAMKRVAVGNQNRQAFEPGTLTRQKK